MMSSSFPIRCMAKLYIVMAIFTNRVQQFVKIYFLD